MKEDEAIRIACLYMEQNGAKLSLERPLAVLVTKERMQSDSRGLKLQKSHPSAWQLIMEKHRDYWSVKFDSGLPKGCLPRSIFVRVDDETGEASIPRVI